jgi:hypothetical protein
MKVAMTVSYQLAARFSFSSGTAPSISPTQ